MKSLTKIISIILLASFLTALFYSCSAKGNSSYDTYKAAAEKTSKLSDFNVTIKLDTEIVSDSYTANMNSVSKILQKNSGTVEIYMETENEYPELGSTSQNSAYFKDDTLYVSTEGLKYKMEQPYDKIKSQFASAIPFDFPEKAFKSAHVKKTGNNSTIGATVKGDILKEIILNCLDSMDNSYIDDGAQEPDFTFSDVNYKITIDENGYINTLVMGFDISYELQSIAVTTKMDMEMTYNEIGKPVTITPPSSLDEYQLFDESSITSSDSASNDTTSIDDGFTEEAFNAVWSLYDKDFNRVPNYDEIYAKLVAEYGRETIDSLIETIEMLSQLKKEN